MLTIFSRRQALRTGGLGLLAIAGLKATDVLASAPRAGEEFSLPPLPYDYAALEPHIDAQTMKIHHDLHHGGYVKNLNAALKSAPDYKYGSIGEILMNLDDVPESIRTAVRNNGGGHANHSLFWEVMAPKGGGEPTGPIAKQIDAQLGRVPEVQGGVLQGGHHPVRLGMGLARGRQGGQARHHLDAQSG